MSSSGSGKGRRDRRTGHTGKRQRGRTSGRDSVTHSVDRCRIVYLISGIINQETRPTLKTARASCGPIVVPRRWNEDEETLIRIRAYVAIIPSIVVVIKTCGVTRIYMANNKPYIRGRLYYLRSIQ